MVAAYGLSRSEETPERAIYALAHDVEHDEVAGVCERLFPSDAVPPSAAQALDLAARTEGGNWDDEHRRCLRDFERSGELETLDFEQPLVRSVRRLSVQPQRGVTAVATASVTFDGEPPTTVKLVEFRGKWRVVLPSR